MYYYKARIYSPTLGRFLQTDPIGYEDQYNLYAYVGNDPINGVDPTGLEQEERSEFPTLGEMVDHITGGEELDLEASWAVLMDNISNVTVNESGNFELAGGLSGTASLVADGLESGSMTITVAYEGETFATLDVFIDSELNVHAASTMQTPLVDIATTTINGRGDVDVGPGDLVRDFSRRGRTLMENLGDRVEATNDIMRDLLDIGG